MAGERYVLLGLAHPRSPWFRDVAQWATSASIAAEFVKCVTPEEVRVRLASGRAHSALLVDASLPAFDRDLVAAAATWDTPVIAVADGRGRRWSPNDIGVAGVLPVGFSRGDLLGALEAHARMIGRGDQLPAMVGEPALARWRGRLVAVTGPGGTGASTAAIGVAQAFAADPRYGRRVLLADLALRADQAMLHDAGDVGPGVQELVEAHRLCRADAPAVEAATFDVPARGYRLLLGLRRPSAWSALRPRAIDAALDGLLGAFQAVVADVTGDVEGEVDCGSIEVEERNHLARATIAGADAVVVVGAPGTKGIHSLAQLLRSLLDAGVTPGRLMPVVNRAPRNPRSRAEQSAALAALLRDRPPLASPVPLPERKVDEAIRHGVALPAAVVDPLGGALNAVLNRQADTAPPGAGPARIRPGALGRWTEAGEDATAT